MATINKWVQTGVKSLNPIEKRKQNGPQIHGFYDNDDKDNRENYQNDKNDDNNNKNNKDNNNDNDKDENDEKDGKDDENGNENGSNKIFLPKFNLMPVPCLG